MGEAPINLRDESGNPVAGQVEGILKRGEYGGEDPVDDSGVLSYVRIEYSGVSIAPNNEINGLTLAGVGRGTRIDHVQVRHTADDCFEFFGGTVDASHLLCQDSGDDGFDWDLGYTGRLQFLLFVDDPGNVDQSNGFEGDNDPDGTGNEPLSDPQIYNATLVGAHQKGAGESYGLLLRAGTRARVRNVLVTGFAAGIDVRDAQTDVSVEGSIFHENTEHVIAFPESEENRRGPYADDDGAMDERALILASGSDNRVEDPKLSVRVDAGDPFVKPRHALVTGAVSPPDDGFFDPNARYVGAFRDESDSWDQGAWAIWEDQ